MKVLLPLAAFIGLGAFLYYKGLLLDLYIILPYSVLGVFGIVGSYVLGQIYRRPLNPRGKAVLITGCDTGYGYHTARALDALGFTVLAGCLDPPSDVTETDQSEATIILNQSETPTDHDQSKPDNSNQSETNNDTEQANKEISDQSKIRTEINADPPNIIDQSKSKIKFFKLNITSDSSVKEAVNYVTTNLDEDHLWAFIHISGVHNQDLIELLPLDAYRNHLEINCLGLVRVTKSFLPLVRAHRSRVIHVMGYQARISQAADSAFSMCQHALLAFTDCLRLEMKPFNVKVITVETAECLVSRPQGVANDQYENGNTQKKNELKTAYSRFEMQTNEKPETEMIRTTTGSVDVIVQAVRSCRPRKRYLSSFPLRMEMWFLAVAPNKLADWYKHRYRNLYKIKKETPERVDRTDSKNSNSESFRKRSNSTKRSQ